MEYSLPKKIYFLLKPFHGCAIIFHFQCHGRIYTSQKRDSVTMGRIYTPFNPGSDTQDRVYTSSQNLFFLLPGRWRAFTVVAESSCLPFFTVHDDRNDRIKGKTAFVRMYIYLHGCLVTTFVCIYLIAVVVKTKCAWQWKGLMGKKLKDANIIGVYNYSS